MNNNPLVSAVITTHNRELNIVKRAIESVLDQTYKKIELIIVNDSSKDYAGNEDLYEYVKAFDSIRIVETKGDTGASAARNCGMKEALGELIAYLDDDDKWNPEKIETQVNSFINYKNDNLGMNYIRGSVLTKDGTVKPFTVIREYNGKCFDEMISFPHNSVGGATIPMFRTYALKAVGGWDESLKVGEDYDLFFRIAKDYEVEFIDKVLSYAVEHDGERLSQEKEAVTWDCNQRVVAKHIDYLKNNKKLYGTVMLDMAKTAHMYRDSAKETYYMNEAKKGNSIGVFIYRLSKLKKRFIK